MAEGAQRKLETHHNDPDLPRFDCGFMEIKDMSDEIEPSPAQIDSFAARYLKVKTSISPEKRIRLGPSPALPKIEESPEIL